MKLALAIFGVLTGLCIICACVTGIFAVKMSSFLLGILCVVFIFGAIAFAILTLAGAVNFEELTRHVSEHMFRRDTSQDTADDKS